MPKLGCIAEITNNFSWLIQTYGLFLRSETQKTISGLCLPKTPAAISSTQFIHFNHKIRIYPHGKSRNARQLIED